MSPDGLEWIDVVSSHVARIAYSGEEALIFVDFTNGDIYRYPADQSEWEAFRNAESKGRYLHFFLKQKGERIS